MRSQRTAKRKKRASGGGHCVDEESVSVVGGWWFVGRFDDSSVLGLGGVVETPFSMQGSSLMAVSAWFGFKEYKFGSVA